MKNIKRIALAVGVSALPFLAFADTAFGTSTAVTTVTTLIGDVALIIGGVIATLLSLYAALVGLGWGTRKFKQYVSGRKF